MLKDYGVLAAWNQSYARVSVYVNQATAWFGKHAPVYLEQINKVIGPYVRVVMDTLADVGNVVWEAAAPARSWANKTIPPILEQVSVRAAHTRLDNNGSA